MQLKLETLFINGLIFALLWLSLIKFGSPPGVGLDPSWTLVLAYAVKHNLQVGIDYVITYGPLGYFLTAYVSYDANLFNQFILWQLVVSSLFASLFFIRASQIENRIEQISYLFLFVVAIGLSDGVLPDHLYFLATVACTFLAIYPPAFLQSPPRYFSFLGLVLLTLVTFILAKFSFFYLVVIGLLGIVVHVWHKYSYQTALKVLIALVCMFLGLWSLLGQSPLNIPTFVLNALQLGSSYDEAMSYEYSELSFKEYYFAVIGISLVSTMILLSCLPKPWQLAKFISGTMILCGLFLAWKAGFVRHDAHSLTFFYFLLGAPFFIQRPQNGNTVTSVIFSVLLFTSVTMGLMGMFYAHKSVGNSVQPRNFIGKWNEQIANNLTTLSSLTTVKAGRDAEVAKLQRDYALPNIQTAVKQATVDVFPPEIAVGLLNGLNYHPRPVYQSHATNTEKLLDLNAQFYASDKAPEFVLFKIGPIDGRFPLTEDSQVLRILLRDYQPVLVEKGWVLLKRHPRGSGLVVNTKEPLLTKTVKFGENLDISHLSDKSLLLSLDIRKSLLGRFTKLFFKLPEVSLVIQTTDGAISAYRIIPSVVKSDFIFNPLILNEREWLAWHTGLPTQRIANFRVMLKPQWSLSSESLEQLFQSEITVRVSENEITPYPIEATNMFYPAFSVAPYAISSTVENKSENGQEVLMVHAPGEMRFHVEPGNHKLTCEFGILVGAYTNTQYPTDGVEFSVSLIENNQESVLFKRLLQPLQVAGDRGIQKCEAAFEVKATGDLVLRTHPGPAGNTASDWSFWRAVKIY